MSNSAIIMNEELRPKFDGKCIDVETSSFLTSNRHGYNVQFSPFDPNCLAVATSQYYGFVGGGSLFLLQANKHDETLNEVNTFEWSDGLFDLAWSEHTANTLVTACGDGSLQLWATDAYEPIYSGYNKPTLCYREHAKEVSSVNWSHPSERPAFLSSSWDSTVRLWDPSFVSSLQTYADHTKLVYAAKFAKRRPNMFASVSADGYLKLWNCSQPRSVVSILAHGDAEVLTCDWSDHDENIIATGGSDNMIKGWDLRYLTCPLFELYGCSAAVRRVAFSPFDPNVLASASYDSATRIWNWQQSCEPIETITHHTEFNYGLAWNRLITNQIADCGWDSLVHVYYPESLS